MKRKFVKKKKKKDNCKEVLIEVFVRIPGIMTLID